MRRARTARSIAVVVAVACGVTSAPVSAQIVTENAGVLSPETPTWREALKFTDFANGREIAWEHRFTIGLDRENELRVSVPTYDRDVMLAGGTARFAGFGDATVRWKRALWREDDVMESGRWSLLAEMTAPTGDQDDRADGQAIPEDLRLGRGDWTFGLGTATTWIRDRHRVSVEAVARHSTAHDGYRQGDRVDLDLAYWYRLAPASFVETDTLEVRAVLELLSSYRLDAELDGDELDDGGAFVRALPGIQVFPSGPLLFEAGVELPLVQTVDDSIGDERYAVLLTVKFLF